MAFYISGSKLLFETTEISTQQRVKLYIFIHNEVRDFDKNSTQPEIRVNRIRDNESQLYIVFFFYFTLLYNGCFSLYLFKQYNIWKPTCS